MNGDKNKDLELQKFYDAEGNEITMLDPVMKEGISTKESVRQMYKKLQDDYRSRAGAPRSIRDMDIEQFKKSRVHDFDWLQGGWFSIKDINIYKDQIYVSYTREVKENCWNTSLLHGKMNLKLIIFENLFTSDECVHFYDNIDGEFNAHQSGGRIINVDDQNLFFSTGDFRSRFRAQKEDSIFSKIIEINKNTKDYKVVSLSLIHI